MGKLTRALTRPLTFPVTAGLLAVLAALPGSGTPTPVSAAFGALTAAGAGGVPVTGSSVTGTNNNHWTVSGGRIAPSATGVSAGLNGSPYSLTGNDGQPISLIVTANEYSVRTLAEEAAALAASGSSKTIRWRDGIYPGLRALSSLSKTGVVVDSDTPLGAVFTGLTTMDTVSGVTFKNKWKYTSASTWTQSDCVVALTDCDVTFDDFEVDGGSETAERDYWFEGFRSQGGAPVWGTGVIHHCRTGIQLDDDAPGDDTIHDVEFHNIFSDGIVFQDHDVDIQRCLFHTFRGRSSQRWGADDEPEDELCQFTGTINVGEMLTRGSGDTKQIIVVAAVDQVAGTIDGYYNNYAKPLEGQTFTGPNGTVTLGSEADGFEGIHGDPIQGINKNATAPRNVTIKHCAVYRTTTHDFDALGNSNTQSGIFLPNYSGDGDSDLGWGALDIDGNLIVGVHSNGIDIDKAASGRVINNTVLQGQYPTNIRTTIDIANSTLTCYGNVSDNGSSGVIKNDGGNTLTLDDYDGDDNGGFPLLRANQVANFPALFTYPQSLASFIPGVGSGVDLAKCGGLLTDGDWRPTDLPTPPVSLGRLDAPQNNSTTASNTVTLASFALSAGSNRRIIVMGQWNKSAGDTRDTTGFSAATITSATAQVANLVLVNSQNSAGSNAFEGGAMYEIAEASLPAGGGPYSISLTANGSACSEGVGIRVMSLQGSPTAKAVTESMADAAVVTGDITDSITPTVTGSYVLGFAAHSSQSTGADWTAGLTEISTQYVINSTATMLLGETTHGNSATTCTANFNGGRGFMITAAWAP